MTLISYSWQQARLLLNPQLRNTHSTNARNSPAWGRRLVDWLYERVRSRVLAGLLGACFLLAACGGGGGNKQASSSSSSASSAASSDRDPGGLSAETASFDLAVGPPARYLIGLFTND